MHSYLGITDSMSRTGWSMGYYAGEFGYTQKKGDDAKKTGFQLLDSGNITIDPNANTGLVRCVRDVR